MNARQRRYLVASLKSLSVLLATVYFVTLGLGWYLAGEPLAAISFVSPISLTLLLLASAGTLWLAHFFTLGTDRRGPRIDQMGWQPERESEDTCPSWPTIFAWLVAELRGEDAHRISSHVSGCDRCRKRLALMNAVQEMSSDKGR